MITDIASRMESTLSGVFATASATNVPFAHETSNARITRYVRVVCGAEENEAKLPTTLLPSLLGIPQLIVSNFGAREVRAGILSRCEQDRIGTAHWSRSKCQPAIYAKEVCVVLHTNNLLLRLRASKY